MTSSAGYDYTLRLGERLMLHGRSGGVYVMHDHSGRLTHTDIDAMVASGDFFVTAATTLDSMANQLTADARVLYPQMERLTTILLYLQRHYRIVRKKPDYRQ